MAKRSPSTKSPALAITRLLPIEKAAEASGIARRTLVNLIHRGELRSVRLPSVRRTFIDPDDLAELIDNARIDP